ncbi:MAG: hypothetical protein ACP5MG_11075 [Verrucomicrobiia bacterium]|jgi:hypothetical protein
MTEDPVQLLKIYIAFLEEIFTTVQKEGANIDLSGAANNIKNPLLINERKNLLNRLPDFISKIKHLRVWWQSLPQTERLKYKDFNALIQQTQNLMLKIITRDRENEQKLLRLGKVPPRYIPAAERQKPHYVAQLYEKQIKLGG